MLAWAAAKVPLWLAVKELFCVLRLTALVSLMMPSDEKWSDKALLIQDYFRLMHALEITLVNEPPTDARRLSRSLFMSTQANRKSVAGLRRPQGRDKIGNHFSTGSSHDLLGQRQELWGKNQFW